MSAGSEGPSLPQWAALGARWSWAFVGFVIAAAVLMSLVTALSAITTPLIIAVVVAVWLAPTVNWFEGHGVPRGIGALLVTFLVVVVATAFVVLVVVGVADRSDELASQLQDAWDELGELSIAGSLTSALSGIEFDLSNASSSMLSGAGATVGSFINSTVGAVSGLFLALVLLYYLLKDGNTLSVRLAARETQKDQQQAERVLSASAHTVRANFRGRTILAAVQGIFVTVVMWALGVPLPLTLGIVNFVGGYVPFFGAFIGGGFAVLMALSAGGVKLAVAALVAVLFMNVVLENLLEPKLIGDSMQMHPIVVLTATVAGGIVAGLLGLILAAPAVSIMSNLFREFKEVGQDAS